jgi:hypothetical protein
MKTTKITKLKARAIKARFSMFDSSGQGVPTTGMEGMAAGQTLQAQP